MLTTLQDFFFPTERNGNLPRSLSGDAFTAYLILVVVLVVSPAYMRRLELASITQNVGRGFTGQAMVQLLNSSRAGAGLPALQINQTLMEAAEDKSADIFAKQYFAHVSPAGKTPWDFLKARSYLYTAAGENLAMDYMNASEAHAGFMNSPSHRDNILSPRYTEVGVAVQQGTFENRASIVVVEYFGNPKAAVPPSATTPSPATPQPVTTPVPAASIVPLPAPPKQEVPVIVPTSTPVREESSPQPSLAVATETAQPQTVLGAETVEQVFDPAYSRAIVGAILIVLVLSLLGMLMRTGIPFEIGVRSLALGAALVYIFVSGGQLYAAPGIMPHTTEEAPATSEAP